MDPNPVEVFDQTNQKTILLVEDEVIIAWMTQQQLETDGYQVILANTGEQAVDLVCQQHIPVDLVLMDINLGAGIDGTQAAQTILNALDIPVIFLSSHTDQETIEKTEKITSYGYVVKNSIPTVLFASIRMAFRLFAANQKIKEKEAEFRILFENSLDGIGLHEIIQDETGKVVDYIFLQVNAAFETHTGVRAQDVINHRATEVYPGLEKTGIIDIYGKVALTGVPATFETYIESDHNYYSVSAYQAGKGRFAAVFENITERKLSEIRLRESEERLLGIINNSSAGYFYIDREGLFQEVNQAWLRMHGFDRAEEIIGKHFSFTQSEQDQESARSIVADVLAGNGLITGEISRRRKDGSVGYHIFTVTPVVKAGAITGLEGFLIDTTQQKQAEQALVENEDRFHILFENAPLGYQALDIDGNLLEVNRVWLDILGYSREEVIGRWFGDFIDPAALKDFRQLYSILIADGEIHGDFPVLCKNGEQKILTFDGRVGSHPDGTFRQAHCILADISERRKADLELERIKKVHRTIIDKSHTQLVYLDPQFNFLAVNKAYADTCHYAPEEMIGKNHFDLYPDAENEAIFKRVRDTGEAVVYHDKPFAFPDQPERGTTYWDWTLSPVKDATGKIEGLVFSLVDTTARKLLEERLTIYQQIVSYSPDGIAVIDKDYRYRMIKGPYQDKSGVDHQAFLGKTVAEFLGEETFQQSIKKNIDRCLTGEMVKYQEWFTLTGNERRYIDVTLIPLRDENGQIQGVVASSRDITDSQMASEQVISLLHEKELLLREVHHRVKNSMNTIYNLLQMQMQSLEETGAKEVLQDAAGRVQSMMVLYDRLNLTENLRGLSLKDYLTPMVEEIVGIFPNKDNVIVKIDIAAVMLSAKQLSHIGLMVNELITNAMKYAFVGREGNEIRLSVTQTAAQVEIVFADNGVGLPAAISLADPPGFGLRIVQILVQQMGGSIEVDREQGTCYHIRFIP